MRVLRRGAGWVLGTLGALLAGISACSILLPFLFFLPSITWERLLSYLAPRCVLLLVALAAWWAERRLRGVRRSRWSGDPDRGDRRASRMARPALAAVVLVTLGVIEIALRSVLGNYANLALRQTGDRCFLKPGSEVTYTGWLLKIPPVKQEVNSLGYRGAARPRSKPSDTQRILLVGDSYTYGMGISKDLTIAALLEAELADAPVARQVEVPNFGVEGFNLEEIVERYATFASRWEHDVVLYLLFSNDLQGPACAAHPSFTWLFRNVYVVRVAFMVSLLVPDILLGGGDPGAMEERLVAGVERLTREAEQNGVAFGMVVLGSPVPSTEWLEAVDVPHLDISAIVLEEENTIPYEGHLNERGTRLVAAAIAEWLQARTWLAAAPGR